MIDEIKKEIRSLADPEKAKSSEWFFKTKEGQYGYGDKFLGLTVPLQRKIAIKFKKLTLPDIESLLKSEYHEERLIAIFILVDKFKKGDNILKKKIVEFYLKKTHYINNWDLVDSSAYKILGVYFHESKNYKILKKLAHSKNLWERRISMIATYEFILKGESKTTYEIAHLLLNDNNDLIQKAVGWMLRESGKRVSEPELKEFLKDNYKKMPRTMLRYAIERLPENIRIKYLKGQI